MNPAQSNRDPGREWMLAFQAGDDRAFDRLVLHYHRGVRRFIGRYLSDAHRAEDIAQEAFIRVFRARRRYQPTAKFETWLYTIVMRLCLNEIRTLRRERKSILLQRPPANAAGEAGEDLVQAVADSRAEGPEEAVERGELEEVLRDAIDALPEHQRAAILMLRFHGAPYRDIAAVLGISVMAVKSLVNRARGTLRHRLERYRAGAASRGSVPGGVEPDLEATGG